MSALPAREPAGRRAVPGSIAAAQWAQIRAAPASVTAGENALEFPDPQAGLRIVPDGIAGR